MRTAIAIAAALLLTAPAFALQPCKTKGSAEAQLIDTLPDPSDTAFYKALAAATQPSTTARVPADACSREPAGAGENTDPFPRVVRRGPGLGYLAPIPMRVADGRSKTVYAIVMVWGSGAVRIGGLLDGLPEDRVLRRILSPDSEGGYDPLEFDAKTQRIIDRNEYLPFMLKRVAGQNNECLRNPACGSN